MRNFANYTLANQALFANEDNLNEFKSLLMDASNGIFNKYTQSETMEMIRTQFNQVLGCDFKTATAQQRHQALRRHKIEVAELIEDVIVDKMVSGWDTANAAFLAYVEDRNLAADDKNEFYVEDTSLLTVSTFAGNHHDIVRQALKPGKAFTVETSKYVIKVYTDFELMQLGKIDFAQMVERMYNSIEKYRLEALYTAFMSMDTSLPSDMKLGTPVSAATVPSIVDMAELVRSVTGKDVLFVGSKVAIQALQGTVSYDIYSDAMKNEKYNNGLLARWEGYECIALPRVNKQGTRISALDDKKIYIMPIDPDFKPIKRVNTGEVMYWESGMDGMKKDMTVDAEIMYEEGIGVVINELFGVIEIQ